jgi:uncharacterized protein YkwD
VTRTRGSLALRILPLAAVLAALAAPSPAAAVTARAAVAACPSAAAMPSSHGADRVERTVLCLLNLERTRRHLPRLHSSARLSRAAVRHSRDMVRRDFFSHVSPGGGTMQDRLQSAGWFRGARSYAFAENIAWGTGELASPLKIVDGWMHSPGHRHNILTRSYRELGVGIALGAPGHAGGATYTTDFGARG